MTTYLIRRILLFFPTLIGATMLVFFVVASAPGGIAAFALSQQGEMRPAEKRFKMEYLNRRYGLNKPLIVQYLRWLNKVSPIGFLTWTVDDEEVKAARAEEERLRAPLREQYRASGMQADQIETEVEKEVNLAPDAGDMRLNRPAFKWPDFGESFTKGRRVSELLADSLPITLLLQSMAVPIEYLLAILTGIWAAKHRGKFIDALSGTVSLGMWSVPVIWAAVLAIGFLANERYLKLFPTNGLNDVRADSMLFLPSWSSEGFQRGWLLDFAWHLVLPISCMIYVAIAFLHKLTRASLLETIQADFVRTARAKGLPEKTVLYAHAFRNSLLPLIVYAASLLPLLITGSIVIETVFGINGMGKLAVEGITQRDRELFLSITLVTMVLGLSGTLLADICNVIADPRVSYDK
jgi:peptide/nickel transport system permease protein